MCGELTQKRFKSLCLLFSLIGYNNQKLSSSKEKSSKPKRRFSAYIIKSCVSHIIFIRWASPVIQIKGKSNYDSSLFSIIIIRHTITIIINILVILWRQQNASYKVRHTLIVVTSLIYSWSPLSALLCLIYIQIFIIWHFIKFAERLYNLSSK